MAYSDTNFDFCNDDSIILRACREKNKGGVSKVGLGEGRGSVPTTTSGGGGRKAREKRLMVMVIDQERFMAQNEYELCD